MELMEPQLPMPGHTPRATRFPLRLRAGYRCEPNRDWHRATTVNVSRTGVLLRGQEPVDVGRPIEIVFRLSNNLLDTTSSTVICQCRVVRIQPAPEHDDDNDDVLIAAEIAAYNIERQQRSGY
jgi:hypothetical protein